MDSVGTLDLIELLTLYTLSSWSITRFRCFSWLPSILWVQPKFRRAQLFEIRCEHHVPIMFLGGTAPLRFWAGAVSCLGLLGNIYTPFLSVDGSSQIILSGCCCRLLVCCAALGYIYRIVFLTGREMLLCAWFHHGTTNLYLKATHFLALGSRFKLYFTGFKYAGQCNLEGSTFYAISLLWFLVFPHLVL